MEDRIREMAEIYQALGDPVRLAMVRLLANRQEMGCGELIEALGISRPTLSYHTRRLQQCGLLAVRKEGSFHFYRLRRDRLKHYAPAVEEEGEGPEAQPPDA